MDWQLSSATTNRGVYKRNGNKRSFIDAANQLIRLCHSIIRTVRQPFKKNRRKHQYFVKNNKLKLNIIVKLFVFLSEYRKI